VVQGWGYHSDGAFSPIQWAADNYYALMGEGNNTILPDEGYGMYYDSDSGLFSDLVGSYGDDWFDNTYGWCYVESGIGNGTLRCRRVGVGERLHLRRRRDGGRVDHRGARHRPAGSGFQRRCRGSGGLGGGQRIHAWPVVASSEASSCRCLDSKKQDSPARTIRSEGDTRCQSSWDGSEALPEHGNV